MATPTTRYVEVDDVQLAYGWRRAAGDPVRSAEQYRRVWCDLDVRHLLERIFVPRSSCRPLRFRRLRPPLRPPLRRRFPERSFSRLSQLLTTVLTDIASSTEQLSAVGNRRWSAILDALDRTVRRQLEHFGGREVNTTGDDVVAVFDTPSAALRCTRAVLVSPTIVDLLLVSDFRLIDRGDHVLKGVVEPWSLFAFGEYGA